MTLLIEKLVTGKDLCDEYLKNLDLDKALNVLDLGCGDGRAVDYFKNKSKNLSYCGIDIDGSPESMSRSRSDALFKSFNGVDIPFESCFFDLVYSIQVFEHVRYPEKLLLEIFRVTKPGSVFVGSVSYLEPYHSFSIHNYTPFGWYTLIKSAAFDSVIIGPGISGLSIINRSIEGPASANKYSNQFKLSPFNCDVTMNNTLSNNEKWEKMIKYADHISFLATKSSYEN